ncbi:hypothetical protein N7533_002582 [Penicillium manginii]|uniref:uncharacterized protein n=1 Tax=Penicillium manginii TaxID=203109 RepID=UPI002548DFD4|nr:uncharacterized protein N7533_002582 [Penicillium manginii]KAJ5763901.1 hypothetical protein N7533_002582 [Penicillium manginii]
MLHSDIDGQIEGCKERIRENIRPYIFEHKPEAYKKSKQHFKARTVEVASRLQTLGEIKTRIERSGNDEYKQLPNVRSLIYAYENNYLDWNENLVTYWSKGQPHFTPRPVDWEEFEVINKANDGQESFLVEGHILLREHKLLPLAGIGLVMGATGSTVINYCELEATLLDSWGRRMTPWTRVMAVCEPGDWFPSGSVPRLDDPFTRLMLYTASAPDSSSNMYVCHKKGPLVNKWYTGCRSSPKPGAYVQAHSKPISNDSGSSGFNDTSHSTSNP